MGAKKAEIADVWAAGAVHKPLTEREARVVPLAKEWDTVKRFGDIEAVQAHIANCLAADCPYLAERAQRKLRELQRSCLTN